MDFHRIDVQRVMLSRHGEASFELVLGIEETSGAPKNGKSLGPIY